MRRGEIQGIALTAKASYLNSTKKESVEGSVQHAADKTLSTSKANSTEIRGPEHDQNYMFRNNRSKISVVTNKITLND